jgi:tetratricopeptide (TPR) repeat protein
MANMAVAYYQTEQWADAESAARQAIEEGEALAPSHTILGVATLKAGDPELAIEHLQQAVDLDPNHGLPHYYLGLAYRILDQPAEAMAAFEEAWIVADEVTLRIQAGRQLRELKGIRDLSEERVE